MPATSSRLTAPSCVCPTDKIDGETPKTNVIKQMTSVLGNHTVLTFASALGLGIVAYSSTHLYVYFCAPSGVWGFVQSLVIMDSTFCQSIMGLVHHSQSLYGAMMVGILFSVIAGLGKCISRATGEPAGAIPTVIQSRPLYRTTS
jgi:hypothetical protein